MHAKYSTDNDYILPFMCDPTGAFLQMKLKILEACKSFIQTNFLKDFHCDDNHRIL